MTDSMDIAAADTLDLGSQGKSDAASPGNLLPDAFPADGTGANPNFQLLFFHSGVIPVSSLFPLKQSDLFQLNKS